jgi:polyhydroxyalkanoate synthesis regulator phasin
MYEDIKEQIQHGKEEISMRRKEIRDFTTRVDKLERALHILEGKKYPKKAKEAEDAGPV